MSCSCESRTNCRRSSVPGLRSKRASACAAAKFYGAFDPVTETYSVCAVLRPDDDPSRFGAERGTLPGGRYACVRLHGEPPGVYEQIGPTAERLAQRSDHDQTRPTLEYYRRRDLIDVLVPVV